MLKQFALDIRAGLIFKRTQPVALALRAGDVRSSNDVAIDIQHRAAAGPPR
jgi:hypothetical protein